jgi:hypothetical protein
MLLKLNWMESERSCQNWLSEVDSYFCWIIKISSKYSTILYKLPLDSIQTILNFIRFYICIAKVIFSRLSYKTHKKTDFRPKYLNPSSNSSINSWYPGTNFWRSVIVQIRGIMNVPIRGIHPYLSWCPGSCSRYKGVNFRSFWVY